MSRISEIIKDLNKLPKGYLSIKFINNKEYYYLQSRVNGKVVSKYIPENLVESTRMQLMYRDLLEEELATLINTGNSLAVVSVRAKQLTGYLMMEDKVVASFNNGVLENIDDKLAPLYIVRTHDISSYLSLRSIDNTRTNSRLLKKALGIKSNDNEIISLHCYGATITDNYWFKAKGSKLKYKDICFNSDLYSDIALSGDLIVYPNRPQLTPELTTPGSFEKCWKYIDNKWYLYKAGNDNEIFSELFISKLAKKIDINTIEYEKDDKYIRSLNFADKYNFEPMIGIVSDDKYENVFNALSNLNKEYLIDYIKLMYLDCLVKNVDRHNENMGLLRDKQTGELIGLAPNFDNNIALLSCQSTLNLDPSKDGFIGLFIKFLKNNTEANSIYKSLKLKEINENMLKQIYKQIDIKVDEQLVSKFIINRYKYLLNIQKG